ncbi:adenosylcobinamide-GDP ribazoletransferase [Sinisalibacter aestuarii]|uniref:Adenosylcobinamide-GDP ribazoletransferase n=1 Tax=Sinisalibacter aestuarii TaxID=2949426 RepID=A0ABQ5LUQ3_9RHOB|nr:adenosylcobinamide-GDP ribazoletransferase [Sinisalibacter aestuarii]GKY88718.1 adenosylcobinamide-GDP ribazoletransferase [Sinisalibacter aestuarii]
MSDPKPDLARPGDIAEALALLTRLPVRAGPPRGAAAAWAWPLAGLAVALIAGLAGWIALAFGVPVGVAAGLVLAAQIAATGALHEDGLADSADGLWGGHDPARRLDIMKDSHIGSYGVLALGLSLLLRWSALSALIGAGWLFAPLIAAAALSRAPMAVLAAALPNARGSGLSSHVGAPDQATATLAVALAALLALLAVGWAMLAPLFWVALAGIAIAALARARIGGQTGDILGASQQLGEIAALAALASAL